MRLGCLVKGSRWGAFSGRAGALEEKAARGGSWRLSLADGGGLELRLGGRKRTEKPSEAGGRWLFVGVKISGG